jgi:hypothetical protein
MSPLAQFINRQQVGRKSAVKLLCRPLWPESKRAKNDVSLFQAHGCAMCRLRRSSYLPSTWMCDVQITQEQLSAKHMDGSAFPKF